MPNPAEFESRESPFLVFMYGQLAITAVTAALVAPPTALLVLCVAFVDVVPVIGAIGAYASAFLWIVLVPWILIRFSIPAYLENFSALLFGARSDGVTYSGVDDLIAKHWQAFRSDFKKIRNVWRA